MYSSRAAFAPDTIAAMESVLLPEEVVDDRTDDYTSGLLGCGSDGPFVEAASRYSSSLTREVLHALLKSHSARIAKNIPVKQIVAIAIMKFEERKATLKEILDCVSSWPWLKEHVEDWGGWEDFASLTDEDCKALGVREEAMYAHTLMRKVSETIG